MSISAVERSVPNAVGLEASGDTLHVKLSDGGTVSIPLDRYPRLAYATKQERANWSLIGKGQGIHWDDIDEDISVEGLLAGKRSGESKRSFVNWLKTRRQPRFRPWKGEGYGERNNLGLPARLLILGESHYEKESDGWGSELTRAVVQDYIEGSVYPFFTKVFHTVLGPDTPAQRSQFFNSIAFYNYVQRSVGDAPDIPPTREMWEDAAAPFRATLECLRPTHIVACGMRLWDNMPYDEDFWARPLKALIDCFGSENFPTTPKRSPKSLLGRYCYSEGESVILAIHHPSWKGYQPCAWHPVVKRFLRYDGSRNT